MPKTGNPPIARPATVHVILETRDNGTPKLWAYRRAVVKIEPGPATLMNYGDGLYGGMFVCGMYSAAFFETRPAQGRRSRAGLHSRQERVALLIKDLLAWSAQYPNDWRKVWQMVEDKWDKNDPCPDGALAPFNIDAKLNGAYIAFGLLFGGTISRRRWRSRPAAARTPTAIPPAPPACSA